MKQHYEIEIWFVVKLREEYILQMLIIHSKTVPTLFVSVQVLMVADMKMTAFWDIVPCSLIEVD
jgi:hypothetical protein